ncbi:MAG: hypothetical protein WBM77_01385 [Maribacter sp.]
MNYLSPQIEALAKKKIRTVAPLVRKGISCGIFQDCGTINLSSTRTTVELAKK